MGSVSYDSDELNRLFASWETIMGQWDDNKSHRIHETTLLSIRQQCGRLVTISESIHRQIARIEQESDSIY